MDFCNVMLQISRFPREKIQTWGIKTVGQYAAFAQHVQNCLSCIALSDAVVEQHKDEPQRPDPSSLN